jgi:CheY-like chemotaxis protein
MSKVMLVDDDEGIRCALGETLREEGFAVVEADSVRAALDQVSASRPNIILCDFCMPGADGMDLLATLQADPALRTVPVILITASPLRAASASVPVVPKPFKLDELLAAIRETLGRQSPSRDIGVGVGN